MVTQFEIDVPDAVLADLRERLVRARYPDAVANGWEQGADVGYIRELCGYWRNGFDWRAAEARLNRLPQFRATVDGTGVHFVHARADGDAAIPLLMLHGWPATFAQFEAIIPLLTGGDAPRFDVVAPSLPGYGFSDRPTAPGMNQTRIARLLHALMTETLGYRRYAIRSSDVGAGVAAAIVRQFPHAVIGSHTGGTNAWIQDVPDDLTPEESAFVAAAQAWRQDDMGYAMMQSTRPQTIAHALNDSPVGLAAWIVEKYRKWGDTGGDVESRFSKDALLTNLTIYWATRTIGSSMRLYWEAMRDHEAWSPAPSDVPVAMLMSSRDLFPTPRSWAERGGPIAHWTEIDRGGHFLEQEEPRLVSDDLRAFLRSLRVCLKMR